MEPDKAADLVHKLRAKAASTTFPEEAKLLTAKADRLARKYRVDEHRRRPRARAPRVAPADVWNMDRQAMGDYLRRNYPRPPAPAQQDAHVDEYGGLHFS